MPGRSLTSAVALLVAVAVAVGGCGSGPTTDRTATRPAPAAKGAEGFERQGGDNSIQGYGREASGAELAEAAGTLHAYLDARAAAAWGEACKRLAPAVSAELVRQLGRGEKKTSCAELLAGLSDVVPQAVLREAARVDVGALRVEGDSGFLLFRGARGDAFFIPVRREDGRWRLAALVPSPLI